MDIPAKIKTPFASGTGALKSTIPETGTTTDETASMQMGFPPRTMTTDVNKIAPTGQDFNGILNKVTEAIRFLQAGGRYAYDSAFATAIGGYPLGAKLIASDGDYEYLNTVAGNTTDPENGGTGWTIIGAKSSHSVGEVIYSALPITDSGLHLMDGSLIPAGGAYDEFVQYVASLQSLCPDVFVTETEWQEIFAQYGSCGKFVYSSSGVRLPSVSSIAQGTTSVSAVGDLVEAGLPNITGSFGVTAPNNHTKYADGAFSAATIADYSSDKVVGSVTNDAIYGYVFDSSRSSSIYGNNTTVQPQTVKQLIYICVATTTKTDIEVDIDNVVTELNGKADVSALDDYLPLAGGTMAGTLTGAGATFTSLSVGGYTAEAVAESGTNYIRYSSGVQVCWNILTPSESSHIAWSYPKAFSSVPSVVATCSSDSGTPNFATIGQPSTTATDIYIRNTNGEFVNGRTTYFIAYGRWK